MAGCVAARVVPRRVGQRHHSHTTGDRDRMRELYLASNGLAGIVSNAIQLVETVKRSRESYLPFLRYQPWLCEGSNVFDTVLWEAAGSGLVSDDVGGVRWTGGLTKLLGCCKGREEGKVAE